MRKLLRVARAVARFLIGVTLTQFLPGALLLAGWGQDLMRRTVLGRWASATGGAVPPECAAWPAFLMAEEPVRKGIRAWPHRLLEGAWRNLARGGVVLACTYVVTLPGVVLMAFSWRYGWDNSFNKGYEQAHIGPVLGLAGVFLFTLAMLYVPFAQAQLAVARQPAAFFRWRIVRAALCCRPWGGVTVAAAYFLAALPIQLFFVAVLFRFNTDAAADLSDEEVLRALRGHYFLAGIFGLPLFAWVRLRAARAYADGVTAAVRANRLAPSETAGMPGLEALIRGLTPDPPQPLKTAARTTVLVPLIVLMLSIWFGFTAQIYVRQFLNYTPLTGWLNQPLVHLPWIRHIPPHLRADTPAREQDLPPY